MVPMEQDGCNRLSQTHHEFIQASRTNDEGIMKTEPEVTQKNIQANEGKVAGAIPEGAGPPPAPQSVAEFRTDARSPGASEEIPNDLLHAFERNYHSHERAWKRMAIVAICAAGAVIAGWLLISVRISQKVSTATKPAGPHTSSIPAVGKQAAATLATPRQGAAPAAPAVSSLPSFIPAAGRDSSFSARKPGWERYAGKSAEFRVFRSEGRIKALQVLAGRGHVISDLLLKSVLKEMTGGGGFVVGSSAQKEGFLIQRCKAARNAGLLIYRKKGTGDMRAFVVSFD